jgi:hypothetical protein
MPLTSSQEWTKWWRHGSAIRSRIYAIAAEGIRSLPLDYQLTSRLIDFHTEKYLAQSPYRQTHRQMGAAL